jgi:hypothetical protein
MTDSTSTEFDGEVTCDYMVPMTVRVNVGTGEVTEVWLHLESFQSSTPGRFKQTLPNGEVREIYLRNAFSDEITHRDGVTPLYGYACDGESELGDKALAIADRVTLDRTEIQITGFTLDPATEEGA